MATNPMNTVDVVAEIVPRLARARSAVLRFGKVTGAAAAGLVPVSVGTGTINCNYLHSQQYLVNDWVALLADGDRWLIIGKVTPTSGAQTGDWYIGDPAGATGSSYFSTRLIGGKVIQAQFTATSTQADGWGIACIVDGVNKAQLTLDQDANLTVYGNDTQFRQIPFATAIGVVTLPMTNQTTSVVVLSFPANRFTTTPIITTSIYSGLSSASQLYAARHYSISASGCTVAIRSAATVTGDLTMHIHAVQLYKVLAADSFPVTGFLSEEEAEAEATLATCRTEGCMNHAQEIELWVPPNVNRVACGVCDKDLLELVPTGRRRGH